jgi:hypothetical protein
MSKKQTGLKRDDTDKFYTKKEVVKLCIDEIKKFVKIDYENDLIIEPSVGNGAFVEDIIMLCKNYEFYDIAFCSQNNLQNNISHFHQINYLEIDIENLYNEKKYLKIHIIGNPPFGRQSSKAKKFIKHSKTNTISFILPKSFKKESMQNCFPKNYHLLDQIDLPTNSFEITDFSDKKFANEKPVNFTSYDVPCIFQIWEKQEIDRRIIPIENPKGYVFVKKDEKPDISFRRVGVYAGKIDTTIQDKNIQSHYFIKFNDDEKNLDEIIEKLKNVKFESDNVVGAKSISKKEVITNFNKIL